MKIFVLISIIICISISCVQGKSDNLETLKAFERLNRSLLNSKMIIENSNISKLKSFEQKEHAVPTAYYAKIWKPKAESAHKISSSVVAYIETIKSALMSEAGLSVTNAHLDEKSDVVERMFLKSNKGKDLFDRLGQFKKNILEIDSSIKSEFEQEFPLNLSTSKEEENRTWQSHHFEKISSIAAVALLTKFQNDIRISEALILDFCQRKVPDNYDGYDEFSVLTGSNSQYFKPGQQLVITAGVGAFSRAAHPTITIDGVVINVNAEGFAEYKTVVGSPGIYSKIVNIQFIKPDGTKESISKTVRYEVGS